jgi:tetratricopeptide (TPR) repeat protein
MNSIKEGVYRSGLLLVALILVAGGALAQSGQGQQQQQQQQQQKKPSLILEDPNAPPPAAPVNVEEENAYKAFMALPNDAHPKRIEAGEAFVQKYPQSRFAGSVYSALTLSYFMSGQTDKMLDRGEKALALIPNDANTLAILAQAISRTWKPGTPESATSLDKAESYSKRAMDVVPTLAKPANITDEAFASVKNQLLSIAHSGLGLVYIHRQKYTEASTELEQAVKVVPAEQVDPVNYFLLGLADEKTSHFDDAIAAFAKCSDMQWQMQAQCKAGVEEAKKLKATQLSAPK